VLFWSTRLVSRIHTALTTDGGASQTYNFTEKGIAWSGIAQNYVVTPGYASPSDVLPPPNWRERFPDGYTEFPNLRADEHFQVWMRIAALPTFRKLWARNDREVMVEGTYRLTANMSEFAIVFANPRLPSQIILWHKVHCHLYSCLDWRQAAIPWMGLYCSCYTMRSAGRRRPGETFGQT
jgi:hypothetical protein